MCFSIFVVAPALMMIVLFIYRVVEREIIPAPLHGRRHLVKKTQVRLNNSIPFCENAQGDMTAFLWTCSFTDALWVASYSVCHSVPSPCTQA
ncbi:hypothetical protein C8R45DRAFT_1223117 [Mycena sanguinolenta]|nr:hypothetical protein C8R45DRAFT_1223117 [Mycena sanguinolenta]